MSAPTPSKFPNRCWSLRLCVSAVSLLFLLAARADDPDEKPDPLIENAKRAYEQNLKTYKDNPDFLPLPGLLADKKAKRIVIDGRATAVGPGDAVEFFVIPADSGKDYEALTVAFAKPSDVHRALEFIGLKPGRPVNYNLNNYWPKGERVLMTVEWTPPAPDDADRGKNPSRKVRAEELVLDIRTKKPLPLSGLVFTGSYIIKPDEGPQAGKELYAADISDSKSIASNYNERSTVLDLPYQWPQSEVYGSLKPNPAHKFSPGQPIQIILEPENKDGKTRVRDLTLKVLAKDRFTLLDSTKKSIKENANLVHILAEFGKLTDAGHDPFVTINIEGNLTLADIKEFFAMIQTLDRDGGIRVEAPPPGQLYYRAFFPEPQWRDRNKRLGRPWELHLKSESKLSGELILPADDIDNNDGKGDLKFPTNTPENLAKTLIEKSDRWSQTVYIFAPPDVKYSDLLSFIGPSLKTHPGVYIFLPPQ